MTSQEIFDAVLPLHQQLVELRDRAKGVAPTWQLSKSRTAWRGKSRSTTATSMLLKSTALGEPVRIDYQT